MRRFASAVAALALVVGVAPGANAQAPGPPSGAELAELAKPPVRTSIASQRFYFVMPDRYRNGDPSNERGWLSGATSVTRYGPTAVGWFYGGELRRLPGSC